MVKVSVPEARRLLGLATTPMSSAARQFGYTWSAGCVSGRLAANR
jgi:hypothetical protein